MYNEFQDILASTVESLIPYRPENSNAVLFDFELITRCFPKDHDVIQFMNEFQVIVTIDSNYKAVFYREYDISLKTKNTKGWVFTSDHDSCWKSDGLCFLHEHLFRHRDLLVDELVGLKLTLPVDKVNACVTFSTSSFRPLFKFVNVKTIKDPNDDRRYSKIITEMSEI